MIRSVVALFVFAVLLCGWIVLRGTAPSTPAPAEVARASTPDLTTPPAAAPAPTPPQRPSALRQRLEQAAPAAQPASAQHQPATPEDIQRAVQVALGQVHVPAAPAPANVHRTQAPAPQPPAEDAAQKALSQGVMSQILSARGLAPTAEPEPEQKRSLSDVVSQALAEGQSDAYVEALLQAAHDRGMFQAQEALTTEDGRVDTRTLLTQIVRQAAALPSAQAPIPAPEERPRAVGGVGVEVRTVQRADGTETYRFYTVQPGDSLGYISQKFYGDAGLYPKIWEANRQILPSPDRIRKGQRLAIPNL